MVLKKNWGRIVEELLLWFWPPTKGNQHSMTSNLSQLDKNDDHPRGHVKAPRKRPSRSCSVSHFQRKCLIFSFLWVHLRKGRAAPNARGGEAGARWGWKEALRSRRGGVRLRNGGGFGVGRGAACAASGCVPDWGGENSERAGAGSTAQPFGIAKTLQLRGEQAQRSSCASVATALLLISPDPARAGDAG